jgi:hypothetical protein
VVLNEFLCHIDCVFDTADGLLDNARRDALHTVGDRLRLLLYAGSGGGRRRAACDAALSARGSLTRGPTATTCRRLTA